ncbi:MAG TPA: YdcF family protein, partial [Rhodanobacteraceae bacterium]|nr:YdcF family protein [Rhodanobacteraceae bacterium]
FIAAALSWRRLARSMRIVVVVAAIVLMAAASPMGANALVWVQEHRAFEPCDGGAPPTAIVALAGGMVARPRDMHDYTALGATSLRRLFGALALRAEHPDATLVLVGISRWDFPESEIMANLAGSMGVPREKMRTETHSLTTWQNATFTAALDPPVPRRIWLVTSALHMPRAAYAFRRAGFEVCTAPAYTLFVGPESPGWFVPQGSSEVKAEDALHEIVGEIGYRLGFGHGGEHTTPRK